MLTPKHCKELDIFKCVEESLEQTDSQARENSNSQNTEQATVKNEVFKALEFIFTHRENIDNIEIEVKDLKIVYSEFLDSIKVFLKFMPQINIKESLQEFDLNIYDATIDQTFAPVLIIRNLKKNSRIKCDFIREILKRFDANISVEIENCPFEINFEDITRQLLMQCYLQHLIKPLNLFNNCLDILVASSESGNIPQDDRTEQLNKLISHLKDTQIYNEQTQTCEKLIRIGNALYFTKEIILDGEKQKVLNFLAHVLKQHPNTVQLEDIPEKMTEDDKKKYEKKFRGTLKTIRNDVMDLKSKQSEVNFDLFEKIEYALEVLDYQNSYTNLKELDCIGKIVDILKKLNLMDISVHLKIAHERSTSSSKETILSTLAELYSALDNLDNSVKCNLDANIGANIAFCTYKDCGVLREMKSKIAHKLEVKKSTIFLDGPDNKVPVYKMRSIYRGTCLIINNIDFKSNSGRRAGADIDEANLKNIFQQTNFEVFDCRNADKEELFRQLKNIKEFSADCLFVIVMSHGAESSSAIESTIVEMSDGDTVKVSDILSKFTYEEYSFPHKPIIFMFQTCRGERSNKTKCKKADEDHLNLNTVTLDTLPNVSNTLIAFATPPGYVAKRHRNSGALFITEFCDVFRKHAHDTHIEDMLIIVDNNIKGRRAIDDPMQTCCFENRGFKHCYFHPGLYEK